MTIFNLDVIEHESIRAPWEFTADGKRWRLPHISDLTIGQQIAADSGRLHVVVREVAEVWDDQAQEWRPGGREAVNVILTRRPDQVGKLSAAWLAHAGVEPGESGASPSD